MDKVENLLSMCEEDSINEKMVPFSQLPSAQRKKVQSVIGTTKVSMSSLGGGGTPEVEVRGSEIVVHIKGKLRLDDKTITKLSKSKLTSISQQGDLIEMKFKD